MRRNHHQEQAVDDHRDVLLGVLTEETGIDFLVAELGASVPQRAPVGLRQASQWSTAPDRERVDLAQGEHLLDGGDQPHHLVRWDRVFRPVPAEGDTFEDAGHVRLPQP